jgi:hypothetical protein
MLEHSDGLIATAFLGSARLQRAGEGVSPSRTFLEGSQSWQTKADPVGSSFRRNAETSTQQGCAPQKRATTRPRFSAVAFTGDATAA